VASLWHFLLLKPGIATLGATITATIFAWLFTATHFGWMDRTFFKGLLTVGSITFVVSAVFGVAFYLFRAKQRVHNADI
jgi:hypothetical protein